MPAHGNGCHSNARRGVLLVTDRQFASGCFPRSSFPAAVTFIIRPVDLGLTGTSTPLRCVFAVALNNALGVSAHGARRIESLRDELCWPSVFSAKVPGKISSRIECDREDRHQDAHSDRDDCRAHEPKTPLAIPGQAHKDQRQHCERRKCLVHPTCGGKMIPEG